MRDTNAAKDLLYRWVCGIVQPFATFTTLRTNIHNEVFKNDDFADDWDAWPTTRRQTRILTWPELVTKMLPWLRISKYFKANVSQYQEGWMALDHNIYHVFYQAAGGVLHVRESLQDCAGRAWDAEGEEGHSLPKVPPRAGRARGLHDIKKISMYDKLSYHYSRWNMPRLMHKCWGRQ